jgi:hypothetical protein
LRGDIIHWNALHDDKIKMLAIVDDEYKGLSVERVVE